MVLIWMSHAPCKLERQQGSLALGVWGDMLARRMRLSFSMKLKPAVLWHLLSNLQRSSSSSKA